MITRAVIGISLAVALFLFIRWDAGEDRERDLKIKENEGRLETIQLDKEIGRETESLSDDELFDYFADGVR